MKKRHGVVQFMDLEYWDIQFYNVKPREISTFANDSVSQYSVSRVSVRMDCM